MRPVNQSRCTDRQPLWKACLLVLAFIGSIIYGFHALVQSVEQETKVNVLREQSWAKTTTGEIRYRARQQLK